MRKKGKMIDQKDVLTLPKNERENLLTFFEYIQAINKRDRKTEITCGDLKSEGFLKYKTAWAIRALNTIYKKLPREQVYDQDELEGGLHVPVFQRPGLDEDTHGDDRCLEGVFTPFTQEVFEVLLQKHGNSRMDKKLLSVPPSPDQKNVVTKSRRHQVDLPHGAHWEDLLLRTKDSSLDTIIIYCNKQYIKEVSYVDLKFYNGEKQQRFDRSWIFLMILSYLSTLNEPKTATVEQMRTSIPEYAGEHKTLSAASVHQTKRKLSTGLKEVFDMQEDPFYEYAEYYQPKFRPEADAGMRKGEIRQQGGEYNDNILYSHDSF